MELNKKCLDMMAYLRKKEDYVSMEELSEQYGVSVRGIRYSLEKIEQYMVAKGQPYLEHERSRGVRFVRSQAVYDFVDGCAGQLDPYQYSYSGEERQAFLRLSLLLAARPVRIEDLCRSLERSRNTVFKDLEDTETWLTANKLTLVKRPRVGLFCEGDEFARRQLATQILLEEVDFSALLRFSTEGTELPGKGAVLLVQCLFSPRTAQLAARSVKRVDGLLGKSFSDESFVELTVQLGIILRRGACGCPPAISDPNADYIPMTTEYGAAKLVLDEFEQQNGCLLPEAEVRYFTYQLLGAKVLRPVMPVDPKLEDQPLMDVTRRMVDDMSRIYNVSFGAQRAEIEQAIFLHLKPAAHRIRFGLYNNNPLYNEIVSNYNALFINTRIVCRHLEEYLGCPVNDHEVSYIALHFAAALHRMNLRTNNKARILLVCGTGLGSARMINSQVSKLFNVEVVGVVSGREAIAMDKSGIDHIITTVPLPQEDGAHYIQVSPLFGERDQQKVAKYLSMRFTPKERYDLEVTTVNRLMAIVEKNCVVSDKLHLQYELLNELMNNQRIAPSPAVEGDVFLCDLLTRDRINTVTCADDWREAIRASAALLEGQGIVTPNYKEAIIRSLEEFGPYMVMLPGIALAHAAPEEGVLGLGMSLTVLTNPVRFGYKAHDPVTVVVTLAAKDEKTHLKALAQLFRMFKDGEDYRIIQKGNKDDILQCITEHSK